MSTRKLDAPYYDGTVSVNSDEIDAIIWGNNGGATLVMKSGAGIRVVDNEKARDLGRTLGLSR